MRIRRVLLALACVCGVAATALACGPYFPNAYFVFGSEMQIIEMPEASFFHEVCKILNVTAPEDEPYREFGVEWEHTLIVDSASFEQALVANGESQESASARIMRYRALRAISHLANDATTETIASLESEFAGAPREFILYAQGAAAYNAGNLAGADEKWTALLALPEDQRRNRSVWAAYMLGRSQRDRDYERAGLAFRQAIDLAQTGFPDPLGLAGESLGWLGYIATADNDPVTALHRYAEQFALGGALMHSAHLSLNETCKGAIGSESTLAAFAQDETCRAIMTAWVVSHPATQQAATEWLNVMDKLGQETAQADLLAWTAYEHGNFAAARKWLAQSSAKTAIAEWVRAKLALRDGKVDNAITALRDTIVLAQAEPSVALETASEFASPAAISDLAQRELGVLLLGRGQYTEALDLYMRAGYWLDAAYIAERVLTDDELITYADASATNPEFSVASDEFYFDSGIFGDEAANSSKSPSRMDVLQYLLSRRLARESRWDDALRYVPQGLLPIAKELAAALQNGRAGEPPETTRTAWEWFLGKRPRAMIDRERATTLFHAGELVREHGMSLMGAEISPDWTVFDGGFALMGADHGRLAKPRSFGPLDDELPQATREVLAASDDEMRRAREHLPSPNKRFHYRYVAADLMWQSAALLPNDDIETLRALWTGGMFIQSRDPQAANKFYRSLVWRNANLPYAQHADKRRWFPPEAPQ
ncbi:MAG: hypothetical protein SGI88_14020 [Candidatus Hydrogenedentes bacterium]|nr:hypothetical protein [Candidatus Hydrogenedentota bacterium]